MLYKVEVAVTVGSSRKSPYLSNYVIITCLKKQIAPNYSLLEFHITVNGGQGFLREYWPLSHL